MIDSSVPGPGQGLNRSFPEALLKQETGCPVVFETSLNTASSTENTMQSSNGQRKGNNSGAFRDH